MRRLPPALDQWLDQYNQLMQTLLAKGFKQTSTNAREGLANLTRDLVTHAPEIAWVQDDLVHAPGFAIPVRMYHPAPDTKLPVLVYYHGGGHMAGSVTVYDPICRKLALATSHIVVSADYRLAPECPYPAGVRDAYHVAKYVWDTLDGRGLSYQRRLCLAGDSGGGALCATVAHLAQYDAGLAVSCQALIYPSLDYTMESASMEENATGYLLQKEKIKWYFDNYFQHAEDRKAASPLHMDFSKRLPQTLVITAEFCPLRDEGTAYVKKVKAAGQLAEQLHFNDMIHAFLNLEDLVPQECDTVYRRIGDFFNRD